MDESQLDELKKETMVDNSKLEELLKKEISPEMQREFLEILKKSRLFMPVTYSQNMFENIENMKPGDTFEIKGPSGFDINYLTDKNGNKAIPLFTSDEAMEKAGVRSSIYALYMSDLADMLKQTDRYSIIAINPFCEYDINMPVQAFLSLFEEASE